MTRPPRAEVFSRPSAHPVSVKLYLRDRWSDKGTKRHVRSSVVSVRGVHPIKETKRDYS